MNERILPSTVERVPQQTADAVNDRIALDTEACALSAAQAGPAAVDERLRQLDREWDIERTLETNAGIAVLVGLALGALVDRRFCALPAVVAGFLVQHAVQGWCPPVPVFRRLGVRTAREIDHERSALKALRGDFRSVPEPAATPGGDETTARVRAALAAARK